MKILFFIESLRPGGKERRIVELLHGLLKRKDITLELALSRNEIHYQSVYNLGIPIHFVERRYLKKDPVVFFKFYRLVKRVKPDIIHVWGHMVAVYAVPSKWLLGIPMINNEITDTTPNPKLLGKRLVFTASDMIISNTEAGLEVYGAPSAKGSVIYNGFNFDRLNSLADPDEIRKRFGIETTRVIAMVASFLNYKDYSTYLKAAQQVIDETQDVTFLAIGDGDDSAYKADIPKQYRSRILFLGRQQHVESIMNICTLGVLTTDVRYHGEGISNALMEFMALGKPVIATDFGGSKELIVDKVTGFLIKPFDTSDLAQKISLLLSDANLRAEMGNQASQRIRTKFSIDSMVSSFYRAYEKLTAESR